jgi:ribonuclease Z
VEGADILVTEATYLDEDHKLARRFGHITAREAAWLAHAAGVRMLVLNHLSQRYRIRAILDEAEELFEPVVVARDFDRFAVTREKITLTNRQLEEDTELLEEDMLNEREL